MEAKIPTARSFTKRFLLLVVGGFLVNAITIMMFYRYTLHATPADQAIITKNAAPFSAAGGVIYIIIIFLIARPLIRFVRSINHTEEYENEYLSYIQDQSLNLGLKMALLACMFYIILTPLTASRGMLALGWPLGTLWYCIFAGGMVSLIMIPFTLNLATWVVRPILNFTIEKASGLSPSRRAGVGISLRAKLLITFLPIICAALLFASMIGYSQTQDILTNMGRMEASFVGAGDEGLVSAIDHKADPGIRSTQFFHDRLGNMKYFYAILIFLATLVSLLMTLFATSEITRPVRVLSSATDRIKQGNIEESIRLVTNDELSDLGKSINQMTEALISQLKRSQDLLEGNRNAVQILAPMAKELVYIAEQQATGSIEQASAAEEAASTSEEIVAVSKQIAENALDLSNVAEDTQEITQESQQRLEMTLEMFDDIDKKVNNIAAAVVALGEQSRQVGNVIKIIDEISEQTNLLSLNAEIESAGAGEHGMRFSVVAQEIRRLAMSTAEATRKIQDIVSHMQKSVGSSIMLAEEGDKAVNTGKGVMQEMAKLFNKIFKANTDSTPRLKQIGLMTSQQSTASEQMANTIGEVREIAKQSASSAEQLQSSINEIENIAEQLQDQIKEDSENMA